MKYLLAVLILSITAKNSVISLILMCPLFPDVIQWTFGGRQAHKKRTHVHVRAAFPLHKYFIRPDVTQCCHGHAAVSVLARLFVS